MQSTTTNAAVDDPWTAAMRRGDYEAAWIISDSILQKRLASGQTCWHWPRHLQYVWTGAPLAEKRVLVRCYHGLGDTIQFIRFAQPLRRLAREVIVWVQPALLDLARTAPGVDKVLPLHDGTPDIGYDVDIEIMELPHALRVTGAPPAEVPYLFPPCEPLMPLGKAELAVGVVWEAGGWEGRRSVPPDLIAQLADVPFARFYSLQRGPAASSAQPLRMSDIGSNDVLRTAARVQQLDLIVSVDTMVAHLAGALARPVWTLLHADCDWRWQQGRSDSVWYPTMRLFRQTRPGDWHSVIDTVRSALAEKAARQSAAAMSDTRLSRSK